MLTMKAQTSLTNAGGYFREHLRVGNYYMEGRSVSEWFGEGATELGLSGVTTESDVRLKLSLFLRPIVFPKFPDCLNTSAWFQAEAERGQPNRR